MNPTNIQTPKPALKTKQAVRLLCLLTMCASLPAAPATNTIRLITLASTRSGGAPHWSVDERIYRFLSPHP